MGESAPAPDALDALAFVREHGGNVKALADAVRKARRESLAAFRASDAGTDHKRLTDRMRTDLAREHYGIGHASDTHAARLAVVESAPYGPLTREHADALSRVESETAARVALVSRDRDGGNGGMLADRQSLVRPLAPGTGTGDKFAPMIGDNGAGAWQAVARVQREAHYGAAVFATVQRLAHGRGRRMPDSNVLDDIRQGAAIHAHALLSTLAADAGAYPIYGDDTESRDAAGRVTRVYAFPLNGRNVIGFVIERFYACMSCDACKARGEGASRYFVGKCAAPRAGADYVDARRAVSRGNYAIASAALKGDGTVSLDAHRDAYGLDAPDDDTADRDRAAALASVPDDVAARLTVVCDALALSGAPITGRNGRLSREALDALALVYGNAPSDNGARKALGKIRAEITR